MDNKKKLTIAMTVLILLTLAFIWGNSLQSPEGSQELSQGVMQLITPFLEIFLGKGNVTSYIVRKLAHFSEFALLGCEVSVLAAIRDSLDRQNIINSLFFGLLIALSDETVQIFSSRGSQVQDVWIDFSGVTAGVLLITVIFRLKERLQKNREQK